MSETFFYQLRDSRKLRKQFPGGNNRPADDDEHGSFLSRAARSGRACSKFVSPSDPAAQRTGGDARTGAFAYADLDGRNLQAHSVKAVHDHVPIILLHQSIPRCRYEHFFKWSELNLLVLRRPQLLDDLHIQPRGLVSAKASTNIDTAVLAPLADQISNFVENSYVRVDVRRRFGIHSCDPAVSPYRAANCRKPFLAPAMTEVPEKGR